MAFEIDVGKPENISDFVKNVFRSKGKSWELEVRGAEAENGLMMYAWFFAATWCKLVVKYGHNRIVLMGAQEVSQFLLSTTLEQSQMVVILVDWIHTFGMKLHAELAGNGFEVLSAVSFHAVPLSDN